MKKAILVDTNEHELDLLSAIVEEFTGITVAGCFTSVREAMVAIRDVGPDIVFLETELSETDGFVVAGMVFEVNPRAFLVFVSHQASHAVKAFEIGAADYVLKPVIKRRLTTTIERFFKLHPQEMFIAKAGDPVVAHIYNTSKIPVWCADTIVLIAPQDICYLEVNNKQTHIYTPANNFTIKKPLKSLEARLKGGNFFRCHKSFMVNLDHVEEIIPWSEQSLMLRISGVDAEIPVGRKYIASLRKIFQL